MTLKPAYPQVKSQHPFAKGLWAAWTMHERNKLLVHDVSGHGRDISVYGGVYQASTPYGPGFYFDGSSRGLQVTDIGLVLPITFAMRVKPLSNPIGIWDTAPHSQNVLRNYSAGSAEWWDSSPTVGMTGITTGRWWSIVATYSFVGGARKIEIYLDGQLVNSGTGAATSAFTNVSPWYLGSVNCGDHGKFYGYMDYFYIYSGVPVTQAQIRSLSVNPYQILESKSLNLRAVAGVTATVRLTWTDSSEGEDGFSIERDTDGGGFVEINTTAAGAETYDDSPDIGHTYTYRVRAISDALGDSEYSNEAEITV